MTFTALANKLRARYAKSKLTLLLLFLRLATNTPEPWLHVYRFMLYVLKRRAHWRILPLVWMDRSKGEARFLLRRGYEGQAFGPDIIGAETVVRNIRVPDVYCRVFRNARVSAGSSSVISDGTLAVIERVQGLDEKKGNYSSGQIIMNGSVSAVADLRPCEAIERGIFLGGNGAFNYYHWMVEIVCKAEFLERLPAKYREFPILLSPDAGSVPSMRDTCRLYFGNRKAILLEDRDPRRVGELVYIDSPNNLPFNLFGDAWARCEYSIIDKRSVDYVRNKALQELDPNAGREDRAGKLFLCRKEERRDYNQDEIFNLLQPHGFQKVFFEDLSFAEQVRVAHRADFIVGPTGAAWTNLLFAKAGAKGLCWMAEESGEFSAYSTIARLVGFDLKYMTYRAGTKSTIDLYRQDYTLDLDGFRGSLAALGLQA